MKARKAQDHQMSHELPTVDEDDRSDPEVLGDEEAGQESGGAGVSNKRTSRGAFAISHREGYFKRS